MTPKIQLSEYKHLVHDERLECFKHESIKSKDTFAYHVSKQLAKTPKVLSPKFFYDSRGSALFEKICNLEEYYIPSIESELLSKYGLDIAQYLKNTMRLVELGSGASIKTHTILELLGVKTSLVEYVPIDISDVIAENCLPMLEKYEHLSVKGIVGTYEGGFDFVSKLDHVPSLIAFLGSSLGNMNHNTASTFLHTIRSSMQDDDLLLIGLDLVKDEKILRAAYDDALGITAEFNKNILYRINSELDADFDLKQFKHHVSYDKTNMCIRMYLQSLQKQTIPIPKSNIVAEFEKNELVHTEDSFKYTPALIKQMLFDADMRVEKMWCDDANMFSITIASPRRLEHI